MSHALLAGQRRDLALLAALSSYAIYILATVTTGYLSGRVVMPS